MTIQITYTCKCGRERREWFPVGFHYSDGCYTILALDEEPQCKLCRAKRAKVEAAHRRQVKP